MRSMEFLLLFHLSAKSSIDSFEAMRLLPHAGIVYTSVHTGRTWVHIHVLACIHTCILFYIAEKERGRI